MTATVRQASRVSLAAGEEAQLRAWALHGSSVGLRNRAAIILAAADGQSNRGIARRLAVHPETVARWRKRFCDLGLDGIRRQAPRPGPVGWSRPRRIDWVRARLAQLTEPGSRSTRRLSRQLGVSHMTVHRALRMGIPRESAPPPPDAFDPGSPSPAVLGSFVGPDGPIVAFRDPPVRLRGIAAELRTGISLTISGAFRPAAGPGPWPLKSLPAPARGPVPAPIGPGFMVFLRAMSERGAPGDPVWIVTGSDRPWTDPAVRSWLERHPNVQAVVRGSRTMPARGGDGPPRPARPGPSRNGPSPRFTPAQGSGVGGRAPSSRALRGAPA